MAKAKILIVEDDAIIAMDIESRLKNLGYSVPAIASSGEKAVQKVEEHHPDLVLMDIVLKGEMDGIDAADIIRSRFGIPVVFLTAHADEKRLERAKLTTPFGFILKPFQDKDLKVTIEMALYISKANAQRKQAEKHQELSIKILELLNQPKERIDAIRDILFLIKEAIGFEAVAIRLQEGEDFPYYHTNGFPAEFVEAERNLCARDQHGERIRDSQGNPHLECMCGNVICERTDSSLPFFTAEGSFWSNNTTELLATTTEADRQTRTRNRCNGEGYESVALIPLRSDAKIIGLLQLNDRRKDMFTLEMIHFFEGIGDSIGIALDRKRTRAALQERMKELNCLYGISALLELPGVSLDEIFERSVMLIPPAWRFPEITAARIVLDGQRFQAQNFRKTPWMQTSKIIVDGRLVGQVEVCYLEEQPESHEGPFVKEERKLLNAIAERLGKIAERMRANEALQESEGKYRSLVDSTNDWVWACDIEGRQTFANEAVKTILGYDVHEIEGVLYENLIDPEDQRKTRQWFKSSIEKKKGWKNSVIRCRHKDGTIKFLESTAQPSFDSKGNMTGFIGIDRDVTERKRTEQALKESEEQLKAMMNHLPSGVVMIDADTHKIVSANPGALQLIGVPEEKVVGSVCHRYICPAKEGECPITDLGQTVDNSERILLKADGQKIPILKSVCKIMLKGKEYLLETFIDITERKKLETQLQQAQKMESIGTLSGGIAHDFNNILFPIMGFAEMALDDAPKNSPLRNKIEEIIQGTKRASALVKQILAFSRQAGQELKPIKVQLVVKEVLKLIRSSIPTTIEIYQNINNKCGYVLADSSQMHQVAMNLMTNAYHAMEDEGGKMEVTLKEIELRDDDLTDPSMTSETYVCLTVTDTGSGIERHVLDHIFEPYFTTKEDGKGTGLGLAVVYGIVKSYGGDIKVYSEPGKGTAFHVYLPVIKSQVKAEETEAIEPIPRGTERILLVDDEEPIVRMEMEMLERLGYQVTARTSSIEALEAFRDSPGKFDLVITDMTMPNMTGVQLSQKLLEIRSDIPIIICTGFSTKIDDAKAKESGIRGFVMKPVVMSELGKKIREVLDQEE